MSHILETPQLQFILHADEAAWSLFSNQPQAPSLEGVRMGVWYHRGKNGYRGLEYWQPDGEDISVEEIPSSQGQLQQILIAMDPDAQGLAYRLKFALVKEQPLFLWKIEVENRGSQAVFLNRLELLNAGQVRFPANLTQNQNSDLAFFSNGWQSWNFTGSYGASDRFQRTRLGIFTEPMRVNAGTPQPKDPGHFGSDMFGVLGNRKTRTAVLAGFLSQCEHFGSLESRLHAPHPSLRMWANGDSALLNPGSRVSTDWACLYFFNVDDADPLGPYVEAVARENRIFYSTAPQAQPERGIPVGWTSWYHYYTKVTAADIRSNLEAAIRLQPEIALDLIQIDDGFEQVVGDWYSFKSSFPDGMAPLAREIQEKGFTPGLWLAPFIVEPRSRLAKEHPQWLLHDYSGKAVNAGFGFSGTLTRGLDLTHPDALAYTQEVIHKAVHDWGYPFLKLDFLYAAALPGRRRDQTSTRAQVMRKGLAALREAAGSETTLLGCGCPLGPALGLVDVMRIGADVSGRWKPAYLGIESIFAPEPDFPAARNAVQNALTRAPQHRRWWMNDPDVLLLRPETRLSLAEIQTLAAVIAMTGGALLLSDDLFRLPPERLKIAQQMLPLVGKRPQVPDWFDSATPQHVRLDLENDTGAWHLLCLFNWKDKPQSLALPLADFGLDPAAPYACREFWTGRTAFIHRGEKTYWQVPAHGNSLVALRPLQGELAQYLGSSLHISQGLEISTWESGPEGVRAEIERPGKDAGQLDLYLQRSPREIRINGISIPWIIGGKGHYRIQVKLDRKASLEVL